jgi:hypothetical protein
MKRVFIDFQREGVPTVRRFLICLVLALGLAVVQAGFLPTAQADSVLYSNIATFTGEGYAIQVSSTDALGTIGTALIADDLHTVAGSGGAAIDSITFSVANFGTTNTTAGIGLRFYSDDNGLPGTLLGALNFNAIPFATGVTYPLTYSPGTTIFTLPTSGNIFAGEFFTNASAPDTTADQLNELGAGLFNPPTIGTSDDSVFQSSATGTSFLTNNPAGSLFNFGGDPVANFGWSLSGTIPAPVPEPSSLMLSVVAGMTLSAVGFRKKLAAKPA